MHNGPVSRTDFGCRDPGVLFEIARDNVVLVINHALLGHLKFVRHFDDFVRYADVPPVQEFHWGGATLRVACRGSAVHPGHQRLDLFRGQPALVRKMTVPRVRKPRRHLLGQHRRLYPRSPRPRLLISQQRHGRHFPRAVTGLTVVLQNRKHVLVEGDGSGVRGARWGGIAQRRYPNQRETGYKYSCQQKPFHGYPLSFGIRNRLEPINCPGFDWARVGTGEFYHISTDFLLPCSYPRPRKTTPRLGSGSLFWSGLLRRVPALRASVKKVATIGVF